MKRCLLFALPLLALGCGKPGSADTGPWAKPSGLETKKFTVEKTLGFTEEQRKKDKLGPETTWAGYSKRFTLELPPSLVTHKPGKRFGLGTFQTTSGGSVSFILLDPVEYKYLNIVPRDWLRQKRADVAKRIEKGAKDVFVGNGWAETQNPANTASGMNINRWLFIALDPKEEYLQVTGRWKEGDKKQEAEVRQAVAYALWSIEPQK